MIDLKQDVKYVKGVGPNRVKLLNKLNIYTLKDLITYYPRNYEDRSVITKLSNVKDGEKYTIEVTALTDVNVRYINRNRSFQKLLVKDETDNCIITWFNQPYVKDNIKRGEKYRFYGKITKKNGVIEMNSPTYDSISNTKNTGKIIPIYPLTNSLKQNNLRKIIENGIKLVENKLPETLPSNYLEKYNLLDINTATKEIHFPETFSDFQNARKRLVFDELLSMQLGLLALRSENESEIKGIKYSKEVEMSDVINNLPFKLTKAQLRVLEDINKDMENEKPMNRLLQGDVGSGKTIVSMVSAYKAVKSGYQVAVLAPTMILAKQHLQNFKNILEQYGIVCEALVGGMTAKKKKELLEKVASGEVNILIGTHAILEENVVFKNLGFVVTDEQHRFGVKQRAKIVSKGNNPDVLVMTATPIPRTLALILYGDLDISIIDELPPNRKKVETYAVSKRYEERVNEFVKKEVRNGRQAYIVCPLVEEGEDESTANLKAVTELYEKYKNDIFKDFKVEYLHGKMKSKEKDEIMNRFKAGEIQILISTTVIEVGVDVPNASVMVIENAERFGLAQLHQLRGRVGRGEYASYCILKYNGGNDIVRQRMEIMTKTDNGFTIAEKDLQLRGSGEFFGTKQHGIPEFKIANLFQDMEELKEVQALAIEIIEKDPKLEKEENKPLKLLVRENFTSKAELTI